MKKQCNRCGEVKTVKDFHKGNAKHGRKSHCKICVKEYSDKRYKDPKTKKHIQEYNKEYQAKRWRESPEHRQKHSALANVCMKKTEQRERKTKYQNNKYATDPLFKLACTTRTRVWEALKTNKSKRTIEYIGCDIASLKSHIEEQFTEGMTWDNYGDWHVDHVVPIAKAQTLEELEPLLHYTNLQPLWGTDNLSKGSLYEGKRFKKSKI